MKLKNKKTGEIQNPNSIVITDDSEKDGVFVFRSIEQLVEEYEDYEPKEPLIKDEKVRNAVREWADRCGVKTVRLFGSEFRYGAKSICFGDDFGLEHLKLYTIAELCGEEEE